MERIDIRKVFQDKNPRLARLLPGFVYRYLERIVHQEFINWFLQEHGDKQGLDFAEAGMKEFNIRYVVHGQEHLPDSGRFIFASNHPLGGFDGIMLIHYVSQRYPRAIFLVNDILMNMRNLSELFVPINKHGAQSRKSVELIEKHYASDVQICTFPSGFVSRRIRGVIQDLPWQKSFIAKAIQHKRNVIPVHMSGRNSNFFYHLASIRKFLGIKANLEMFYLVDETYKHRDKTIHMTFGKPVPYTHFTREKTHREWAEHVREIVYSQAHSASGP